MKSTKSSVWADLSNIKGIIISVITLDTAIATFASQVMKWAVDETLAILAGASILVLLFSFVISRSERRADDRFGLIEKQMEESKVRATERSDELQKVLVEIRKDTLRIQLRDYIRNDPQNTDTVLKIAQEYFVAYHGNWVETAEFLAWADKYKVKISPELLASIHH